MLTRLKTGSFPLWIGAAATVAVIVSFFLPREKEYEFGDFPESGVYTHHLGTRWFDPNHIEPITDVFTVVNPLDETISLSIGAKSCSCVAADFTDTELLPHETAAVKLTITLEAFGTEHKQKILNAIKDAGYQATLEDAIL